MILARSGETTVTFVPTLAIVSKVISLTFSYANPMPDNRTPRAAQGSLKVKYATHCFTLVFEDGFGFKKVPPSDNTSAVTKRNSLEIELQKLSHSITIN